MPEGIIVVPVEKLEERFGIKADSLLSQDEEYLSTIKTKKGLAIGFYSKNIEDPKSVDLSRVNLARLLREAIEFYEKDKPIKDSDKIVYYTENALEFIRKKRNSERAVDVLTENPLKIEPVSPSSNISQNKPASQPSAPETSINVFENFPENPLKIEPVSPPSNIPQNKPASAEPSVAPATSTVKKNIIQIPAREIIGRLPKKETELFTELFATDELLPPKSAPPKAPEKHIKELEKLLADPNVKDLHIMFITDDKGVIDLKKSGFNDVRELYQGIRTLSLYKNDIRRNNVIQSQKNQETEPKKPTKTSDSSYARKFLYDPVNDAFITKVAQVELTKESPYSYAAQFDPFSEQFEQFNLNTPKKSTPLGVEQFDPLSDQYNLNAPTETNKLSSGQQLTTSASSTSLSQSSDEGASLSGSSAPHASEKVSDQIIPSSGNGLSQNETSNQSTLNSQNPSTLTANNQTTASGGSPPGSTPTMVSQNSGSSQGKPSNLDEPKKQVPDLDIKHTRENQTLSLTPSGQSVRDSVSTQPAENLTSTQSISTPKMQEMSKKQGGVHFTWKKSQTSQIIDTQGRTMSLAEFEGLTKKWDERVQKAKEEQNEDQDAALFKGVTCNKYANGSIKTTVEIPEKIKQEITHTYDDKQHCPIITMSDPPDDQTISLLIESSREMAPLTLQHPCKEPKIALKLLEASLIMDVEINLHPQNEKELENDERYLKLMALKGNTEALEEFRKKVADQPAYEFGQEIEFPKLKRKDISRSTS